MCVQYLVCNLSSWAISADGCMLAVHAWPESENDENEMHSPLLCEVAASANHAWYTTAMTTLPEWLASTMKLLLFYCRTRV